MMKRTRYEVVPTTKKYRRENPLAGPWSVTRNGDVVGTWDRQRAAIKSAAMIATQALIQNGQLAMLKIKGKNGRIRDERTYGADPRRTKG